MTISRTRARHFLLAYQGLFQGFQLQGKDGICRYIKRVGCIQFDPLNIVGHNPELVLQSRIHTFHPSMLTELLYKDRKLLDGWDKNMSIYCIADWPCFQRNRDQARIKYGNNSRPAVKILPLIRKALEERGPLSSLDLDFNQIVGWSWSPTRIARAALESMYAWGELIVHHKIHTRKVYDFASRHIPEKILKAPDPHIRDEEYYDWYCLRRIGSVGLLWDKSGNAWLGISGMKSKQRQESISRLHGQKKIHKIIIKGIDRPFYIRDNDMSLLEQTNSLKIKPAARIIAPLDNLIWDRDLIKKLFDFEYRWEVYKPASQRQYGYYVLPVLYDDRFIARFEPAIDKKNSILIIKKWWWENNYKQTEVMHSAIKKCFHNFMNYLGVSALKVECRKKEIQKLFEQL